MAGGDATLQHNAVRGIFADYCRRANLRPEFEAPGLLASSRERPADILVVPQLALARELPDGSRRVTTERICFDFAVVNALGPGQWPETTTGSGASAEAYDVHKRRRNNTESRCREQGLTFWPVVFEQQGGRTKAANVAIRAIAESVAEREGAEVDTVRRAFDHRLAITLARCGADMIARRQRASIHTRPKWCNAVAAALALDDVQIANASPTATATQASQAAGTVNQAPGAYAAVARDIRLGA